MDGAGVDPTVVLVHGAFADASSWGGVIAELERDGHRVLAAANPLRGLAGDAAYIASVAEQIDGPVVLVGHSYGGSVITVAGASAPNVIGLVFVAAFIPDEGESVADINGRYPVTATPPTYHPATYPVDGPDGSAVELSVSADTFPVAFAADVPRGVASIAAVAQRPFAVACTVEKASAAAWRKLPSWAVVATADQMIHPDAERAMAVRAGARVVEAGGASHAVALSQPGVVADQIRAALAAAPVRTA